MANTKTHLLHALQSAYKKAILELKDESPGMFQSLNNKPITRKGFIGAATTAGIALGLGSPLLSYGSAKEEKDLPVAIIGGGLAGLYAAHIFRKGDIKYKIYEASNRPGGRVCSAQNMMADGVTTELGGEFINSNQTDILNLLDEFGLQKVDFKNDAEQNNLSPIAWVFDGTFYKDEEVIAALKKFIPAIQADKELVDKKDKDALKKFDNMGIDAYLQQLGITGWLYKLLTTAFVSEFGLEASEQSALNFIENIAVNATTQFEPFAGNDKRYRIVGGSEVLASKLSEFITDSFERNHKLISIALEGGEYVLKFENGKTVRATYVLLTLPFSILRKVDIQVKLPTKKRKAIDELGYGTNGKIFLSFKERTWRKQGYAGYLYNDVLQSGWDSSQLQNGNAGAGGYTLCLGGQAGTDIKNGAEEKYLDKLYKIFPGTLEDYSGKTFCFNWSNNEYAMGSYSCYKKGQWLGIAGAEFEPVGNLHFAGEHCSEQFRATMNGAVETGKKAAMAIAEKVKAKKKPK